MAANMAENPQASLPEQAGSWAATQAAYRFLDNDRVTPQAIQAAAIEVTRRACGGPVTLMLHDLTPLDPVRPLSPTVLLQHTTLAVDGAPGGPLHGVMYQRAFDRPIQPQGESRRQRRGRWTQSRSWPDAVQAIGSSNGVGRWLHVADREADSFEMLRACLDAGHGFVIRAQHDRHLTDGGRLRETLWRKPIVGGFTVNVNAKGAVGEKAPINRRRVAQPGRIARCLVRVAQVTFAPPQNDRKRSTNW